MTEKVTQCIGCSSKDLKYLGKKYPDQLCRCSHCGIVQFTKDPTEQELVTHYANYPVSGTISAITRKRYSELLDLLEKFRNTGRILDIGCGEGFFLEEAQNRGWKVFGTEFAEKYISICKEKHIEMHYGKLNPDHYSEGFFDVITWFEVIEHINYPANELKNIHRLLRKNGALYITTPNFNALSRQWLKGKWSVIEYPEHLAYYTPRTLRNILKKAGFSSIRIKTTGISPGRITQSVGRLSNETFHDVDRVWQQQLEKNNGMKLLKSVVNWFLNLTGTGDSMKALFRKSS